MSDFGVFRQMLLLLSGTGRGTGGGLMAGYRKSAPAGTPSCASVGLRGVLNCTAHTLCAAAIEETEALQLQQKQAPNH